MILIHEDSSRCIYAFQRWDDALIGLERKAKREGFYVDNSGGVLCIVAPDQSEQWLMYTNIANAIYGCFLDYNLLAEILNLPEFRTTTLVKIN
jgi:hypothetical protein